MEEQDQRAMLKFAILLLGYVLIFCALDLIGEELTRRGILPLM